MASTRKITYSTVNGGGSKEIFSNAATWGDLRNSEPDIAMLATNMKPWVRDAEGQTGKGHGLTRDSDELPEGSFSITFLTQKNDSGK